HPGVAALAPRRALRRDDLELVDAAQERLLQRKHLGDLPHGVQRHVLVVKRLHGSHLPGEMVSGQQGGTPRWPPVLRVPAVNYSASSLASPGVPTAILRGLASSRTGMRISSTPSWWLASIASASRLSERRTRRVKLPNSRSRTTGFSPSVLVSSRVALTVRTPLSTVTSSLSCSTPGTSKRRTTSPSRRTVSIGRAWA